MDCRSFVVLLSASASVVRAQETHYYQADFPKEEFLQRRATVFAKIGDNAIALVQGAKGTADFNIFRQSNEFYYLSGIETPHAYLMLDGRSPTTTLYPAASGCRAGTQRGQDPLRRGRGPGQVADRRRCGAEHRVAVARPGRQGPGASARVAVVHAR
jgi:hypothetical protein